MARLRMEGVIADSEIPTPASGTATIFYNSTERVYKVKLDDGSVAPIGSGGGGAVASVNGQTGTVVLTKADIGLSNADNTSDANKPISSATQLALDAKYDASNPDNFVDAAGAASAAPVQSVAGQTGVVTLSKSDVGLSNVDNTSDLNKPISTATQTALDTKLDLAGGNMTGNINMEEAGSGVQVIGSFGGTSEGISTYNFAPIYPDTLSVPIQIKNGLDVLLGTIIFNPMSLSLEYVAEPGSTLPALTNIGGLPLFALANGQNLTFLTINYSEVYNPVVPLKAVTGSGPSVYHKVVGLADATSSRDAVNKQQLDTAIAGIVVPVTSVAGKTGAVTLSSADVGLGSVNNTSDLDKPISTATQMYVDTGLSSLGDRVGTVEGEVVALDSAVSGLDTRVTAVEGSVGTLNANVVTLQSDVSSMQTEIGTIESELVNVNSAIAAKYDASNPANYVDATAAAAAAPVQSVAGKTGTVTLSKSDVGLNNVDNTSDANKPISTATATALSGKLDLSGGSMTGAIAMGGFAITGMLNPSLAQDAATKAYVDSVATGIATVVQATAYVSKNGNDSTAQINNTTKPFLTIAAAISALDVAGYNTPYNPSMIFIAPGIYVENLTLKPCIGLATLSGTLDYTVTIQGAHTFSPTSGIISANQINLIGLLLQNPTNSASTLAFTGAAPGRMRIVDCSIDMGNNTGSNPTIYVNNSGSGSHISLWGRITQSGVSKSSPTGDTIQIVAGGVNSYGYDISSTGGNAINMSGGSFAVGYGTIASAGQQAITASGGSGSLSVVQVYNPTSNKDGILQSGTSAITCGIVTFNIAGTTGYCARGAGTFVYTGLTFIGASGNTRIQSTLTRVAIPATPTFVT